MAHKVILPPQKNYIPQFLKQRDINSYSVPPPPSTRTSQPVSWGITLFDPRCKAKQTGGLGSTLALFIDTVAWHLLLLASLPPHPRGDYFLPGIFTKPK